MAGLIAETKEAGGNMAEVEDTGIKESSNPELEKLEDAIESKIPPQFKKPYLAIVVAGNKILFADETKDKIAQAAAQPEFIQKIPSEIAQVITVIRDNSGKNQQGQPNMNVEAARPAGITLAVHLLGFAEQLSGTPITPAIAMQTIKGTTQAIDKVIGMSQQSQQTQQKAPQVAMPQQGQPQGLIAPQGQPQAQPMAMGA